MKARELKEMFAKLEKCFGKHANFKEVVNTVNLLAEVAGNLNKKGE